MKSSSDIVLASLELRVQGKQEQQAASSVLAQPFVCRGAAVVVVMRQQLSASCHSHRLKYSYKNDKTLTR